MLKLVIEDYSVFYNYDYNILSFNLYALNPLITIFPVTHFHGTSTP